MKRKRHFGLIHKESNMAIFPHFKRKRSLKYPKDHNPKCPDIRLKSLSLLPSNETLSKISGAISFGVPEKSLDLWFREKWNFEKPKSISLTWPLESTMMLDILISPCDVFLEWSKWTALIICPIICSFWSFYLLREGVLGVLRCVFCWSVPWEWQCPPFPSIGKRFWFPSRCLIFWECNLT